MVLNSTTNTSRPLDYCINSLRFYLSSSLALSFALCFPALADLIMTWMGHNNLAHFCIFSLLYDISMFLNRWKTGFDICMLLTSWVRSDCIDTSVLIRCTIATATQASFIYSAVDCSATQPWFMWLYSIGKGETITPRKDSIIINSQERIGKLQLHCHSKPMFHAVGKHCNNKLPLSACSLLIYLALHFPFRASSLALWNCNFTLSRLWLNSEIHLRSVA